MTEGSSPDEEEGEKGSDLFAHLPGYQPFQQMPMWPGQSVAPGQNPAQNPAQTPAQNPAQNLNQHPVQHPGQNPGQYPQQNQGMSPGSFSGQMPGQGPLGAPAPPQLALPEAEIRPLLLPAKPKGNTRTNLSVGRPAEEQAHPDAAAAAGPWGAPRQQQNQPQPLPHPGQPGTMPQPGHNSQPAWPAQQGQAPHPGQITQQSWPVQPGQRPQPGPGPINQPSTYGQQPYPGQQPHPGQQPNPGQQPHSGQQPHPGLQSQVHPTQAGQYGHPGQIDPLFVPPTPGAPLPSAGFVPNPAAIIADINIGATPKSKLNSGEPVVSSASAKPNWTQPQWPGGEVRPGGIHQALARRGTGSALPPQIAPQPLAPYSQAPPSSGNVIRNLFAPNNQINPGRNQFDLAQTGAQANQGFRSQIPFTIKRDLAFAKQLLGDQAQRPRTRNEYKQTEYIPKQPKLKVQTVDPNRPWSPVPAAQYDFFAEEEKPAFGQQNTIHPLAPPQPQPSPDQIARGFNAATAPVTGAIDEMEAQPDPRYSPFQGELLKDIARQDRRFGHQEEPIPLEKKERGAAALRALGRNSDHFYDNQMPGTPGDEQPSQAIKLSSRDVFGLVTYYFIVTKEVLTAPQSFFANMSLVGGLNDPLLYLVFTSLMAGIFSAVAKLNIFNFFGAAIFGFLSVALSAVLMQIIFKKLGGQGKFEQTFNVLAYSKATFIFAWISLGPFPIGAILATLATAYLNYLGLTRVQKLPPATTLMVIGGMTIFPLLFKIFGPK